MAGMIDYSIRPRGPLFDGRLARVVRPALDGAAHDVARHGQDIVWLLGHRTFKTWTNTWGGSLVTERRADDWVTHDNVIYGPWLEGVSSRNASTRFKGYRTFRRAQQELDAKTPTIVEASIKRSVLGRLLGGG
jgi:hypothetical protein